MPPHPLTIPPRLHFSPPAIPLRPRRPHRRLFHMDYPLQAVVLSCVPAPTRSAALSDHPALSAAAEDRISSLPSYLLSNIVSRLPIKAAVRTTVLSTKWRRVWTSTPLVLDDRHLLPASERQVVCTVSRILMTHPGPFLYVSLTLGFFGFHHREIEFWPRLLASKRVQHLVWVNHPPPMDLPMSAGMLRCSNLQSLYIGFWKLPEMSAPYHHQHAFPHLMKLVIGHCLVESRNLELMLKHSPSLLTLSFVSCYRTPRTVEIQRNSTLSNIVFWCSMVDVLPVVDLPRLNRLILWNATSVSANTQMAVKIACVFHLQVLGYLEPGVHQLQIWDALIKEWTMPSPAVPSVRVLALKVSFRVRKLARMVPAFLRCFPNVDTLHIESGKSDSSAGKLNLSFWQCAAPIECVNTCVETLVFHEFKGDRSEITFLKFVAESAQKLQKMVILLSSECPLSMDAAESTVNATVGYAKWANKDCELVFCTYEDPEARSTFTFQNASDGTLRGPFIEMPSI